jgi:uncharacterized protein
MITVKKNNHRGRFVWQYIGDVLERTENCIKLEAVFGRDTVDIGLLTFATGDKMIEWFYADRYFNVFQLHDGKTEHIKGWYCNITRPASFTEEAIVSDDLALDVVVLPEGKVHVLDEAEFQRLEIPTADRQAALAAVEQIKTWVSEKHGPFAKLAR